MKLLKKIAFDHENRKYEIRIFSDEKIMNFVVFYNKHPFNCFRYQILIPKYLNVQKILRTKMIDHFVDITKADVRENRWEKFLKEK